VRRALPGDHGVARGRERLRTCGETSWEVAPTCVRKCQNPAVSGYGVNFQRIDSKDAAGPRPADERAFDFLAEPFRIIGHGRPGARIEQRAGYDVDVELLELMLSSRVD
jgi:hypothetical protein